MELEFFWRIGLQTKLMGKGAMQSHFMMSHKVAISVIMHCFCHV